MPLVAKYSLPEFLREKLKEPIGFLVSENELIDYLKQGTIVVSVGDKVTGTLIHHDIPPAICIIDYQSKRKENDDELNKLLRSFGKTVEQVVNPPGLITNELWDCIKRTYNSLQKDSSIRIEVEGEEDLAALPAIIMAPENVTIIYGLPDRGVVVVPSTEEYKQKVKEILAEM